MAMGMAMGDHGLQIWNHKNALFGLFDRDKVKNCNQITIIVWPLSLR